MSLTVYAALLGYPVFAAALFWMLPARRALLACYLVGWLFLPMTGWMIPGIPDYTKPSAVTFVPLVCACLFDSARVLRFRPSLLDLPILVWCLIPIATAASNGLGIYEGVSDCFDRTVEWGLPYLTGRIYFTEPGAVTDLALAIVVGGMIYMPLCLWEAKMSPRLHEQVYGFQQHDWIQTLRFEGWRPQVFMQHGLAVAMFMAMSTVVGVWLMWSRTASAIRGFPLWAVVAGLFVTTILCRSGLAAMCMVAGLGALAWMKYVRLRIALLVLVLASPMYIYARTAGNWSAEPLVAAARAVSVDRSQSLQARIDSEDILWEHARERRFLGWGRGRTRPQDEEGRDLGIQDGYWIIAVGLNGLIGLTAFMGVILLPAVVMIRRLPAAAWTSATLGPAGVLSVVLALVMCDNVMNAMYNPIWILCAGAVAGTAISLRRNVRARALPQPHSPGWVQR